MARSQQRSRRKSTGGLYRSYRTKRKFELARFSANTKLSKEKKVKAIRIKGGKAKRILLSATTINVADKKGKAVKTEILNVVGNPANPHLVRRNIITKGAIVETKLGRARVTSRPGQEGTVNGVLV